MKKRAFTLIELLIVVAIIGILAAIAVPNFLNAQVRAKIARVRSDMRSIAVACDSYRLDNNAFPWPIRNGLVWDTSNHIGNCIELTTPIAYLSSVMMEDPFIPQRFWNDFSANRAHPSYVYVSYRGDWGVKWGASSAGVPVSDLPNGFGLTSQGPDGTDSGGVHWPLQVKYLNNRQAANNHLYHPSNGLRSYGDITRYGGDVPAPAILGGG
ncbi:MAG: prepilin-type N-terminal cleavage/methylation domain-containing protein [Planctomycetes bacterium]|nr:prepilin-type N-terminal cleavage/methylation domain-containing protein [Planctomycetota bacterium]